MNTCGILGTSHFCRIYLVPLVLLMAVAPHHHPVFAGEPPVSFEDSSALLDFTLRSWDSGGNGMNGAAWFDYDNDGFLDLFLTNGCDQDNGLFRNNGDGTFTNVAAEAGVENGFGNNGVVAADIDNDGHQDSVLTGEGGYLGTCERPVNLYHNNGDGTFARAVD